MQNSPEQLNKKNHDWELNVSEKADMRKSLLLFIKSRSVMSGQLQRHYLWSNLQSNFQLLFLKPMPIFITLIVLLSSSVTFGAEKALPGDVLYPVKINFNEQVRGWASLTSESKADWEIKIAGRRLEEAETLAVESRLSSNVRASLESSFQSFADRAGTRIDAFEKRDSDKAAKIASNFETALRVHEQILLSINRAKDGDQEPEVKALAIKVRAEAEKSGKNKNQKEDEVIRGTQVQASAEGRMKAVQNKIAEVSRFVESRKEELGVQAIVQVEARLKMASDTLASGQVKLRAGQYGEAFVLFGKAHAIAQEVQLLVRAKTKLEESVSPTPSPSPSISHAGAKINNQTEINSEGGDARSNSRIRIELGL